MRINNKIDYSEDEKLFELSRTSRTTTLYYNAKNSFSKNLQEKNGLQTYVPCELENGKIWGSENGIWCDYEEIPEDLKDAFVAIEDHRFFSHNGVDWLRTAKAVSNYVLHYDSRFGGSTITQQLIKNIGNDKEISAERKIREILRARHIEKKYDKKEILELYMNIVPMSENCVGVFSAAEIYFSKKPSELTLAECATLAAITNSPSLYNPAKNPEKNLLRRNLILDSMLEYGYITEEEYKDAYSSPITLNMKERDEESLVQSWYAETVIDDVIADLMAKKEMSYEAAFRMVYSGGLKIYTLMDRDIQATLENYFENYYNFPKEARTKSLQYAMTVIDPKNGDLLGVVGAVGDKKANRLMNFATKSLMPPGSSIKPLSVYAPALEEGLICWSTVFDDTPVFFYKNRSTYTPWPRNYPAIYSGLTDVSTALAYSKNTVAVKIYNLLGAERVYSYLVNKLHMNNIVRSAESNGKKYSDLASAPLALGQLSFGATLRDMTSAYTSFSDGNYHKCRSYLAVCDSFGNLILENQEEKEYVWSEQNASIMTQLLSNVVSYGTAKDIKLKYTVDTAGKTGTSNEDRDRWFIGYTPYFTAGIWCGYPNRDREVGDLSKTHLEVWDEVMKLLHRKIINESEEELLGFKLAPGIVKCEYCRDSGKLCSHECAYDPRGERSKVGYFTRATMPRQSCDRHILVDYDSENGGVLNVGEESEDFEDITREIKKVALIRESRRDFPIQIYISDAQYVYRELNGAKIARSLDLPFFANTIKKGRFVGTSYANKMQFNAFCCENSEKKDESKEENEEENDNSSDIPQNEKDTESTDIEYED